MLTLRSSPSSPFVRKVRIAASVLGLEPEIALEPADTMNASDPVRRQNPLGKIPALVLEDGTVLFDSRVILDYLDHRAGGGRILGPVGLRGPLSAGRAARAEMARSSVRQDRPCARRARGRSAGAVDDAGCGADRARLRARLSRFPFRRNVAARASASRRLARPLRRARACLRRDCAAGIIPRWFRKAQIYSVRGEAKETTRACAGRVREGFPIAARPAPGWQ